MLKPGGVLCRSPPCHLFWSSTLKHHLHKNKATACIVIGSPGRVNARGTAVLLVPSSRVEVKLAACKLPPLG